MELIAQGHSPAFQEIYRRYSRLVYGYGLRLLKDRASAEDSAQEVWIRIVRLAASYRGEGQLKSWLLTVTRNMAMTQIRKRGLVVDKDHQEIDEREVPSRDFIQNIEAAQAIRWIGELPEAQRLSLTMWIAEDLSYEQIATELGLSGSSVKALIFRARQTLKERAS